MQGRQKLIMEGIALPVYAAAQTLAGRAATVAFWWRGFVWRPIRRNFLQEQSVKTLLKTALALTAVAIAAQAAAQVTFYEQDEFQGRSFTTDKPVANFERFGFNDRASSVDVANERWEVCENARFKGQCIVLRPGRYPSLAAMGLNNQVTSVRAVSRYARIDERRYAPVPVVAPMVPRVTFYEQDGFQGRSFTTDKQVGNFERFGFNDRASSVEVTGAPWEVCEDVRFNGRCAVLRPGRYPSLAAMGLSDRVSSVRIMTRDTRNAPVPVPVAASVIPQVIFYEHDGFQGRSLRTDKSLENFDRDGFNDRASSVEVIGASWQVCEDVRFNGRCAVLRPGHYPTLAAMGLNDRISSVRSVSRDARVDDPHQVAAPDYRQSNGERLYEVKVTSVRAVVGTPEQRCWVEREQISQEQQNTNVPAAIAGALIGGILGHQVGGGTGKDLATIGGVVAGAAVGANVGRNGSAQPAPAQNVQRCESVSGPVRPQYWDVTYNFRGQEHRIQMTAAPGPTVIVNEQGEPRK